MRFSYQLEYYFGVYKFHVYLGWIACQKLQCNYYDLVLPILQTVLMQI